jgi:hypothetical protein
LLLPEYAELIKLIAPKFLIEVVNRHLHGLPLSEYPQWAKFITKCYLMSKDIVEALCTTAPDSFASVAEPLRVWSTLITSLRFELLEPMVANSIVLKSFEYLDIDSNVAMELAHKAPLRVAMLIACVTIVNKSSDFYHNLVDIMFKRLRKDIKEFLMDDRDSLIPEQLRLWQLMAGVDPFSTLANEYDLAPWYVSWDQSRVKWLLKEGAPLISRCIRLISKPAAPLPPNTVYNASCSVHAIYLAQLNILAAKENWDGFLTTSVSYHKLLSSLKDLKDFKRWETATHVACMVGFFRLGNMEKARKVALQLDSEVGPGRHFDYLDSVHVWNKLTSATHGSAAQSSSVKPAAKAGGAKKKKNKKKAVAAQPETAPAAFAVASSSVPAESTGIDLSVQYEPDSKPAKLSSDQAAPSASSHIGATTSTEILASVSRAIDAADQSSSSSASDQNQSSLLPASWSTSSADHTAYKQTSQSRVIYAACPICLECFPDCVIVPCGHTFCASCIKQLTFCSICRERVGQWIRMYISQGESDY